MVSWSPSPAPRWPLLLALLAPAGACLYTDPIREPAQPDPSSPSTLDVGACAPSDGEPVLLTGPGSTVDFQCFIGRAEGVQWSMFVDGVERVVLNFPGPDALHYRVSYDDLPRPLPQTLSVKLVATRGEVEIAREWPVQVQR